MLLSRRKEARMRWEAGRTQLGPGPPSFPAHLSLLRRSSERLANSKAISIISDSARYADLVFPALQPRPNSQSSEVTLLLLLPSFERLSLSPPTTPPRLSTLPSRPRTLQSSRSTSSSQGRSTADSQVSSTSPLRSRPRAFLAYAFPSFPLFR